MWYPGRPGEVLMTGTRPFTLVAAIIFLCMALIHLYRIAVGLEVTVGMALVPMMASWAGLVIAAFLSVMLFRESRS
jgi:uncharacterized membrane protein